MPNAAEEWCSSDFLVDILSVNYVEEEPNMGGE
jgi:hypothetical protein